MKYTLQFLLIIFIFALPAVVFGVGPDLEIIDSYSEGVINSINRFLVPVLLAVAFIVFLWGVFKNFIWKAESGEAHTEGSKFVAWGLIGFVVILSLWALVNIVQSTLGLTGTNTRPANLQPPTF
jgi:hypothetical protein